MLRYLPGEVPNLDPDDSEDFEDVRPLAPPAVGLLYVFGEPMEGAYYPPYYQGLIA